MDLSLQITAAETHRITDEITQSQQVLRHLLHDAANDRPIHPASIAAATAEQRHRTRLSLALIDATRIRAGTLARTLRTYPVDLRACLGAMADWYDRHGHGVPLICAAASDRAPHGIVGDADRLTRMLLECARWCATLPSAQAITVDLAHVETPHGVVIGIHCVGGQLDHALRERIAWRCAADFGSGYMWDAIVAIADLHHARVALAAAGEVPTLTIHLPA